MPPRALPCDHTHQPPSHAPPAITTIGPCALSCYPDPPPCARARCPLPQISPPPIRRSTCSPAMNAATTIRRCARSLATSTPPPLRALPWHHRHLPLRMFPCHHNLHPPPSQPARARSPATTTPPFPARARAPCHHNLLPPCACSPAISAPPPYALARSLSPTNPLPQRAHNPLPLSTPQTPTPPDKCPSTTTTHLQDCPQ